jgi:hemerythrin-like domain-containing protein
MCDYCDCRSHPQIASLSDDHEAMLLMLASLSAALTTDDADLAHGLLSELHHLLDAHGVREERGIFTELRDAVTDDDYVGMFEQDHQRLHELFVQGGGADWRRAASEIVKSLNEHILREETDLFPAAHQMLTPDQWRAVDSATLELSAKGSAP